LKYQKIYYTKATTITIWNMHYDKTMAVTLQYQRGIPFANKYLECEFAIYDLLIDVLF